MAANHALASQGRDILCQALEVELPAPEHMLGAMAALILPGPTSSGPLDPLQETLRREENIDVPVFRWGNPPRRILRLSAQLYNAEHEFRRLASALRTCVGRK
jgi:isopenicillin-N epimerase